VVPELSSVILRYLSHTNSTRPKKRALRGFDTAVVQLVSCFAPHKTHFKFSFSFAMSQARRASFSPLLKGPSIFEQLQRSHFREFYPAFKTVKTYLPDEDFLTLPKLVVVGTSNAGKSSLLENITKCAIFPRDKKLCTKFPLRLRIQQVSDVNECGVTISHDGVDVPLASPEDALEVITKIMDQAERLDDLTGQELLVVIKQVQHANKHQELLDRHYSSNRFATERLVFACRLMYQLSSSLISQAYRLLPPKLTRSLLTFSTPTFVTTTPWCCVLWMRRNPWTTAQL